MSHREIRRLFLDFFKNKNHTIVGSSSLIPDDSSVLLTTAGMQQFKPYFVAKANPMKDFRSKNTVSIQKCFRTSDIDEVGDESHLTFFEMLGHFSFGDYFKNETIKWTYELLTDVFGIPASRIRAAVFRGDETVPFDEDSFSVWSKFLPQEQISKGSRSDNFWGPAGTEGPCGAANEVYVDDLEVATLVFMEYYCLADRTLTLLPKNGVDVGWGFERLAMIVQKTKDIFETDLFRPLMTLIAPVISLKTKRIISDHIRGIAFLLADGVRPSNKEAGYILRKLIRRIVAYEYLNRKSAPRAFGPKAHWASPSDSVALGLGQLGRTPGLSISGGFDNLLETVIKEYQGFYPELLSAKPEILFEFNEEKNRFIKTLERGLKELEKMKTIDALAAFKLYETFGLPYEIIKELAGGELANLQREDFEKAFLKHQEISRAGAVKKFGGHGLILDTGELKATNEEEAKKVIRLHTATHLLHQALREVLGSSVRQMGSDINAERTRFDFTFSRKLTKEELLKIEEIVNKKISEDLVVSFKELPKAQAEKTGALHFFKAKYPDVVKVYFIAKPDSGIESAYSREFCAGPHVQRTSAIGRFKVFKEETISSGVRRIRAAVLEN